MLLSLYRSLWGYRGFILGSVKREFQARYRNSLFGALWTVLNPLSMIVVYKTEAVMDYYNALLAEREDAIDSWLGAKTSITRTAESTVSENTP